MYKMQVRQPERHDECNLSRALQFITMVSQEASKAEKQIDRLDRLSSFGHGTSSKYAKEIACYKSKFSNSILLIGIERWLSGAGVLFPRKEKDALF